MLLLVLRGGVATCAVKRLLSSSRVSLHAKDRSSTRHPLLLPLQPPTPISSPQTLPPRSASDLSRNTVELGTTLWMLPIIYLILMAKRLLLTMAFRPLFRAVKGDLVGGGRGWGEGGGLGG